LDSANITQDFHPLSNEEFDDIDHEYKLSIFKNRRIGRILNASVIEIDGALYKIFVMNDEFKNMKIGINFTGLLKNNFIKPNLIKIKCENIRTQVHNNMYTNDIELLQWDSYKAQNHHYFHEFETRIFIPLLTTTLTELKFYITDEYDEILNLETGLPTILSVTFKK